MANQCELSPALVIVALDPPRPTPCAREVLPDALREVDVAADAAATATKPQGLARFFDPEDGQLDLS